MSTNLSIHQQKRLLAHFFLITYLLLLFITMDSVAFGAAKAEGPGALIFMIAAFLCYNLVYLLPAILLTKRAGRLSNWRKFDDAPARRLPAYAVAVLSSGLTLLFFYANAKVYALYGMYFNGFIINLLVTPGGIESLGGSSASDAGFALIALGFVAMQALLLLVVHIVYRKSLARHLLPKRVYGFALAIMAVAIVGVHASYAIDAFTKARLGALAESIPFFQPVSARHVLASLGFKGTRDSGLDVKGKLNYPAHALNVTPPAKPYNIVWLTSESWRADMLDQEIMPQTWQFAQSAHRYTRNYSGGNGTRMGVFSMFMGMPGNYWFPFLRERRGAALIDVLQQQNYQMSLYTSAHFSYPEFDKTIFSQVPAKQLHWLEGGQGWKKDQGNVTDMLHFIGNRDKSRPFFTFMFFESPHARYYFPPESVIRRPYRDDINYATLSRDVLAKDIVQIKNRYINSVHHLDSQFGRVFDYLKANHLLDSTIVVLVGDHGEEFMEHGFWGHNSTFVDQQIRTPLVLWVPGMQPQVSDKMTSHMDIVPTLMPLLGVKNPADDYSTGYNLLGDKTRDHTYVSDWDKITYIDDQVKVTQSVNIKSYSGMRITTGDDKPLSEEDAQRIMQGKHAAMTQIVRDMSKFLVSGNSKRISQ
ncbi:MAG TPA: sulfatase-like hydrolase/transferase [Methylophilaceae bacterium]|nr:sulfatase-like hydrolase/transferase [Methylophilaceae bacterium]